MKKIIILTIFSLFIISFIKCDDKNNTLSDNKDKEIPENETDIEADYENETEYENEEREEEESEDSAGIYISLRFYKQKLKDILEEKNLKPKKKITKDQLEIIFNLIYKEDEPEEEAKQIHEETGLTHEEQNNQYWKTLFNEVAKGLDYDDKIRVKDIDDWIHPDRVREAYATLLEGLAQNLQYL